MGRPLATVSDSLPDPCQLPPSSLPGPPAGRGSPERVDAQTRNGGPGRQARIPRRDRMAVRYGIGGSVGEPFKYVKAFRTLVTAWASFMK